MFKQLLSIKYWRSIIFLVQIINKSRGNNSILGGIWRVLQPFLHVIVISSFMSFVLKYEPKILVANLVGALPFWSFITTSLMDASKSLINKSTILRKIAIPKTYFPISDILANIFTLLYSFVSMYIALIIFFPEFISWKIIFVPILSLPIIICVISGGIAISFLTPYAEDIPQFTNVMLSLIYWTIPIIYPYSVIPESKKIFFELNPFFITMYPIQDLIMNDQIPSFIVLLKSCIVAFLVTIISFFIFKKLHKNVIFYL